VDARTLAHAGLMTLYINRASYGKTRDKIIQRLNFDIKITYMMPQCVLHLPERKPVSGKFSEDGRYRVTEYIVSTDAKINSPKCPYSPFS
jgi:hypothetical protein